MSVYDEIYGLRQSSHIRNLVTVALMKACRDIYAEDVGIPNHANRLTWANVTITTQGESEAQRFMWAVIANDAVRAAGEAATDAEIQTAVDNVVNLFAV